MASLPPEEQIAFLLACIKSSECEPDFAAVAVDTGIEKRPQARKRYKAIIEHSGKYLLTGENRVVAKDDDNVATTSGENGAKATTPAPETDKAKTLAAPATAETTDDKGDDDADGAEAVGTKTPTTPTPKKRGRPKKDEGTPGSSVKKSRKPRQTKKEKEQELKGADAAKTANGESGEGVNEEAGEKSNETAADGVERGAVEETVA